MPKPKFATEQKIIGQWEKVAEGKRRVQIQCVCGGTRWLYLWSWAGHGWAKCYGCNARLEYVSGNVVREYKSKFAVDIPLQYNGNNARTVAPPYLMDGVWFYDIETYKSELIAAVPEYELSQYSAKKKVPPVVLIEQSPSLLNLTGLQHDYTLPRQISEPKELAMPATPSQQERPESPSVMFISSPPECAETAQNAVKAVTEGYAPQLAITKRVRDLHDETLKFLADYYAPSEKPFMMERLQDMVVLRYLLTGDDEFEIHHLEAEIRERQGK